MDKGKAASEMRVFKVKEGQMKGVSIQKNPASKKLWPIPTIEAARGRFTDQEWEDFQKRSKTAPSGSKKTGEQEEMET